MFEHSIRSGNTYVQADVLLEEAIRTLEASRPVEISPDQVANEIITLVEHGKIQQEETKLLRTVSIFLNGALVLRFSVYFLVKRNSL